MNVSSDHHIHQKLLPLLDEGHVNVGRFRVKFINYILKIYSPYAFDADLSNFVRFIFGTRQFVMGYMILNATGEIQFWCRTFPIPRSEMPRIFMPHTEGFFHIDGKFFEVEFQCYRNGRCVDSIRMRFTDSENDLLNCYFMVLN